jgi:hypothetical protein
VEGVGFEAGDSMRTVYRFGSSEQARRLAWRRKTGNQTGGVLI